MSGLQSLLVALAAVKAVKEHLSTVEEATKAAIKAEVGGRMGATGAVLPDGTEGGTVWITKPTVHLGGLPYVADRRAFTDWCKANRPDAIEEVVRGTSEKAILGAISDTGEVPDGVAFTQGGTSGGGVVSVRQSDEQRDNLIREWRAGKIVLPSVLPMIEEGETDEG